MIRFQQKFSKPSHVSGLLSVPDVQNVTSSATLFGRAQN
jgi:hypothetical protein